MSNKTDDGNKDENVGKENADGQEEILSISERIKNLQIDVKEKEFRQRPEIVLVSDLDNEPTPTILQRINSIKDVRKSVTETGNFIFEGICHKVTTQNPPPEKSGCQLIEHDEQSPQHQQKPTVKLRKEFKTNESKSEQDCIAKSDISHGESKINFDEERLGIGVKPSERKKEKKKILEDKPNLKKYSNPGNENLSVSVNARSVNSTSYNTEPIQLKTTITKLENLLELNSCNKNVENSLMVNKLSHIPTKPIYAAQQNDDTNSKKDVTGFSRTEKSFNIDIAILLDCTDSMERYIEQMRNDIGGIVTDITARFKCKVRVAFVGYRDHSDGPYRIEYLDFTDDLSLLHTFLSNITAFGGGDAPEDVFGGLEKATSLRWSSKHRLLIQFGDAPQHGGRFHDIAPYEDFYYTEEPRGLKVEDLLNHIKELGIKYYFGRITNHTDKMISLFQEIGGKDIVIYVDIKEHRMLKDMVKRCVKLALN